MLPAAALRMTIDYPSLPPDADDALKMSVEMAKEQVL